jgi:hypothetical protein
LPLSRKRERGDHEVVGEGLYGGVKTPPFRVLDSRQSSVARNPDQVRFNAAFISVEDEYPCSNLSSHFA